MMSARARNTDPETSHDAARSMDPTLPELEALVFDVLLASGWHGCILDDFVKALKLDKVTVSPRLRPLCDKGLAVATKSRRLGKSGRRQTVWVATRWEKK